MSEFTAPFAEKQTPSPITIPGFLAAIAFNAVVFSFGFLLWTERGPYQWIAAAQYAVMESYGQRLTLILMVLLFMPIGLLLVRPIHRSGRWACFIAYGPSLLAVGAHFLMTAYFLITGGTRSEGTTLNEAVRSATFLPQAVSIDTKFLSALDESHSAHIARETSRIETYRKEISGSHYIPFQNEVSHDPRFPVVFRSGGFALEGLSRQAEVEGMIYKAPLPYLLRRNWEGDNAAFGVIISNQQSVHEYWFPFGILYGVVLISMVAVYFSRRSSRRS